MEEGGAGVGGGGGGVGGGGAGAGVGEDDFICYSLYCLPYISCDISLENLALDQLLIP